MENILKTVRRFTMKVRMSVLSKNLQVLVIEAEFNSNNIPKAEHACMTYSVGGATVDLYAPSDQFLNDMIQECQIELRRRAGDIPYDVNK